tara:strand:+ start:556 stop:693 length:138 start_codon:yes stop_codon:yes gene_type:complete
MIDEGGAYKQTGEEIDKEYEEQREAEIFKNEDKVLTELAGRNNGS